MTDRILAILEEPAGDGGTKFDVVARGVARELTSSTEWAVKTFWDRLEGKPNSIAVEDAKEFARALLDTVKRHVTDETTLHAIANDMAAIYAPASRELQTHDSE